MKKLSIALAAAMLTVAPIAFANAEEGSPTAAPVEAAAPAAEAVKSVTLADGTVVQIEGGMVYVVDSYGAKTAAPDGEHKAADGTTIVVKEGKLVETPTTEAAPATGHEGHEGEKAAE